MGQELTFDDLVDDGTGVAIEAQRRLIELVGPNPAWQVRGRTLSLFGNYGRLDTTMHLLGTTSGADGTWLWSWDNPALTDTDVAQFVREFGTAHGIVEFATASDTWNGFELSVAARAVTRLPFGYSYEFGSGSRAFTLLEHPELELPQPSVAAASAVLAEALQGGVRDRRRVVQGYARARRIAHTWDDDFSAITLTLPDGAMTLEFAPVPTR